MNIQNSQRTNNIDDQPHAQPDRARPSQAETDQARPRPTHWLTLDEVSHIFAAEGVERTRRVLARYCQTERLIGTKDAGPNGDEWYVDPVSVPRAIAELKMIHRHRGGEPDPAGPGPTETVSHDTNVADLALRAGGADETIAADDGNSRPKIDADPVRPRQTETDHAGRGPTETDLAIFEHPHVKRLERDIELWKDEAQQWKGEYKRQVTTTQQIQQQSFDKMMELQRIIQVGQSKTLADFFLKAKDWILPGQPLDDDGDSRQPHDRAAL